MIGDVLQRARPGRFSRRVGTGSVEESVLRKQLGYSEFSFGYAFTENLVRSSASGTRPAPRFPNLREEGRAGYDVEVSVGGAPLFLQYKLPERMVRSTAAEISKHELWRSGLSTPFFRMYLTRKDLSRQHELLVALERKEPGSVFYAMPKIVGQETFNRAYAAVAVHKESVLFSPEEIGSLPDDTQHVVVYDPCLGKAWFCSDPKPVEPRNVASVLAERGRAATVAPGGLGSVARAVSNRVLSIGPSQLADLATSARERIQESRRTMSADEGRGEETTEVVTELLVAREVARVGLGVELLIAQPRR